MTIISSISNFGSVKGSSLNQMYSFNTSNLSFNSNKISSNSHQHDDGTHLANVSVLANVLGILGLGVKAKVL